MIPQKLQYIVCAGMMRSASTWLYELVRQTLAQSYPVYSDGDRGQPLPSPSPDRITVLKIHEPRPQLSQYDPLIIYTWRNLKDATASVIRRYYPKGVTNRQFRANVGATVAGDFYWRPRADLILAYSDIQNDASTAASKVLDLLRHHGAAIPSDPGVAARITDYIKANFPDHRTTDGSEGTYRQTLTPDQLEYLRQLEEQGIQCVGHSQT